MAFIHSKVTAQGQISIPSAVRKKLGVRPGSVLEWHERDGEMIVRRAGKYSFEDIHAALFREKAPSKNDKELKEGIRRYMRIRHGID